MGRVLRSADDGDHGDGGQDPQREQHVIGLCLFAACCLRVVNREHVHRCTRILYPLVPRRWEHSTAPGTLVPAFCTRLFPVFPNVLHVAQEGPKPKKWRTAVDVRQQQFAAKQAALLAAHKRPAPPPATGQPLLTQDEAQGCGL